MNENEFSELQQLSAELIWRVPLAFACVVGFLAILASISEQELPQGCEDRITRSNPDVGTPGLMVFLRCVAAISFVRFAWIYFAEGRAAISHLEALAWLVWYMFGLPLWTWHEKERMTR